MVEIEAVINSRPLSYVHVYSSDSEKPLISSHLLVGRRLLTLPDHLEYVCNTGDEDFEVSPGLLTKRMKYLANVFQLLLEVVEISIGELRECHCYAAKKSKYEPHDSCGEVVIVHDDSFGNEESN